MNYFVSIGAGINQIPLILEARHAGFQVIGVDMNPSAPGFYHCDLKIQESIQDYENIYIKLRELLIDGISAQQEHICFLFIGQHPHSAI